jgi:uncharacterized protein (TIGR02172 family)
MIQSHASGVFPDALFSTRLWESTNNPSSATGGADPVTDQPAPTLADLGAPIARGRTAEIYVWQPGWVIKLFLPRYSRTSVEHEADIARKVWATGLRAPAIDQVVAVDGRYGILYEQVDGTSLLQKLRRQPWQLVAIARLMGRLHADMHSRPAPTLPALRDRLPRRIEQAAPLPARLRPKVLATLQQLPDGDVLCHGDFHPDNILETAQGPIIIDWNDATHGHPLADVARTLVLARFGTSPDPAVRFTAEQAMRWLLRAVYLFNYRRRRPYERAMLRQWLIPVAAARLAENITEEEPQLLAYLEQLCGDQ